MSFITKSELMDLADINIKEMHGYYGDYSGMEKRASQILFQSNQELENQNYTYKIFLSHSFSDAKIVLGLKLYLEQKLGLKTYVDWIDSPKMDRSSVNKITANKLREHMMYSKSLIYATSKNANQSRWMPWELGYFDGLKKGKIAVLPITDNADETFKGEEYVGLYDIVKRESNWSRGDGYNLTVNGERLSTWISK